MARLQILELPEGADDARPPFVLIVDQADETIAAALGMTEGPFIPVEGEQRLLSRPSVAEQIGARCVLVFEETIAIPANEVAVDADGQPIRWPAAEHSEATL